MNIGIIVLNWKQPKLTIDTIESLLKIKSVGFDYQIVLVDNGSTDDSLPTLIQKYQTNPKIKILSLLQNLGYAGGNNFGIDYALKNNFDYVLLINNDVLVDPEFLQNLVKATKKDPISILGPKIYFAPGFEYHKDRYKKNEIGRVIWSAGGVIDWNNVYASNIGIDEVDNGQFDNSNLKADFISGCCILVNTEIFRKIGKLDDDFFMYLEDVDFCQRAKKHGFSLNYVPKSIIWHVNSGSSQAGGDLQNYFLTRNRITFALRFASFKTKFAIIREAIRQLFTSNSKWQKQGVIDFLLHKTGKGSWL
jgi:GT2 family glycosyltransferase